jgi:hypothetical protein
MSKFALIEIEAVKGKQKFYKLEKDGVCEFDIFETEARKFYNSQINSIYHRMDALAQGKRLPIQQFRVLKGGLENITECELKTKNLRVYYFIDKANGSIVITGGYKKEQKKDINRFRGVINKYLESKRSSL